MSNTNELPKEIWMSEIAKKAFQENPLPELAFVYVSTKPTEGDIPYIRKDIHESEMERVKKENIEACKQAYLQGRRDANSSMT